MLLRHDPKHFTDTSGTGAAAVPVGVGAGAAGFGAGATGFGAGAAGFGASGFAITGEGGQKIGGLGG